jgi:mono/diheme cytochrome c family protein
MSYRLGSWLFGLLALAACSGARPGATDATFAKASADAAPGGATFSAQCARCHGERGQGQAYSPTIMGAGALPVYPRDTSGAPMTTDPVQLQLQSQTRPPGAPSRNPFRNARDLYDYLLQHKPNDSLRALPPADLWPLITFMLIAHGSQVPAGGVTSDNADQVGI